MSSLFAVVLFWLIVPVAFTVVAIIMTTLILNITISVLGIALTASPFCC